MITVKDILKASAFQNSEILAGEEGLLDEVTTITVAEVPDAANWLRGGELVCTTAFFVSNQVVHQQQWISSLIKNGASALAIKTSRFLGIVPAEIIKVANESNFPIISLPHEITWPIVIESFMDFFMNERMKLMTLVEEVQSSLINLVLENKDIQAIANKIASLVGNPIVLEDARLQLIAIGGLEENDCERKQEILAHRVDQPFKKRLLDSKFYKNIKKGDSEDTFEIIGKTAGNHEYLTIMIPILSNKSVYGFISLVEYNKRHTSVDFIILRNSTTALALQLMKQYLNEQTIREKNQALIEDIIHGRIHTQIVYEYDFLKINWSNPMIVIMVDFIERNVTQDSKLWDRSEESIFRIIKKHLEKRFGQVIIGHDDSLFTVLVSFSPKQASQLTSILKEEIAAVIKELSEHFGSDKFQVGVGGVHPDLKLVGRSYKEAQTALGIVKKFPRKGSLLFHEDIGIHRILSMITNIKEIQEFCDDFLLDLKGYDSETGNEFLETLHMFLLCDCSIKETAQNLFLHPNTVAYRIRKIKQIIKHDLDSPEIKMAYLFALESNILIDH